MFLLYTKIKGSYTNAEETNFKMSDINYADKILGKLKTNYAAQGAKIKKIDGISVIFPDWWFNLRKSESEPVIRLNLEASSKELFEEKKEEVINLIKNTL